LEPEKNSSPQEVVAALRQADLIFAGPGDLYTTILPILLVRDIKSLLKNTKAKKVFIVNIANKPFETPEYKASDFVKAVHKHIGAFPFGYTIVNNNQKPVIPSKLHYTYVNIDLGSLTPYNTRIISSDLVNPDFPLYHDPQKLAREVIKLL
jgi:uncharacterized cofD-like protein